MKSAFGYILAWLMGVPVALMVFSMILGLL